MQVGGHKIQGGGGDFLIFRYVQTYLCSNIQIFAYVLIVTLVWKFHGAKYVTSHEKIF